jgi:hypothetical protein
VGAEAERDRLEADARRVVNWKRWGPYLSERQWATVREDYSPQGTVWDYFPHDHARSRAYRWGEDGLLGIADRQCRLCFALALWNGRDPFLKERLFGLAGPEGNHGEDVKECYYYLDSTPTHSYMRALYKYPQAEFPYARLVEENRHRRRHEPEFELTDAGLFDGNRYFDLFVEYAKAGPEDLLIRITACNRGPQAASLHLLPTLWYRNTWIWGCRHDGCWIRPSLRAVGDGALQGEHVDFGRHHLVAGPAPDGRIPALLFTENETNSRKLFGVENRTPYVKDAFHDYVVHGAIGAVNPRQEGTKAAALYRLEVSAGGQATLRLRLATQALAPGTCLGEEFEELFAERMREADAFYADLLPAASTAQERGVLRQAYAGLLWSKQFYHYIVRDWLDGDPEQPTPPAGRLSGRNADWPHVYNRDVVSMPDKWEYPWYAAWDLAFHMIPFAGIDPEFAKQQLVLFLREWYMHPNGQLPAYEYNLGDVNPPVHAWACWRVFKMTGARGERDRVFLSRCFQKLLINFTWWVNRKDLEGRNLFAGGFLGLDNIGVFDRSRPLPTGGSLEQADGTAWMAFFCATMLSISLELARENPATEDMASKFFEHFIAIADAINRHGGTGLWNEEDGFYYDQLRVDGRTVPLRIRSLVGLIPLLAVEVLDDDTIRSLAGFRRRLDWFLANRSDLHSQISYCPYLESHEGHCHRLLAIPSREKLERVLRYLLDEREFLSPHGIRSVSAVHRERPYVFRVDGRDYRVDYEPAESATALFGGNSNWRGPVWFPINYLLIEALERYHHFYGDGLRVECPTGSGTLMNLEEVARELSARLARIFLPDERGRRPCHGEDPRYADDPHWRDLLLFHEYFHGDTGRGLGASHQTGWTALVVQNLRELARRRGAAPQDPRPPSPGH